MRISQRAGIEKRLAEAERVVARRVMPRAIALLADEHRASDWKTRRAIEVTMARFAAGELGTDDPVRAVLVELAKSSPEIAARIAAAVGIEIPEPSTTTATP